MAAVVNKDISTHRKNRYFTTVPDIGLSDLSGKDSLIFIVRLISRADPYLFYLKLSTITDRFPFILTKFHSYTKTLPAMIKKNDIPQKTACL